MKDKTYYQVEYLFFTTTLCYFISNKGVPPAMLGQHQYIMGQQGMPYFNVQQPIYGFEDYQHQLMQSRVPMVSINIS